MHTDSHICTIMNTQWSPSNLDKMQAYFLMDISQGLNSEAYSLEPAIKMQKEIITENIKFDLLRLWQIYWGCHS